MDSYLHESFKMIYGLMSHLNVQSNLGDSDYKQVIV